jgi:hypothetical protein
MSPSKTQIANAHNFGTCSIFVQLRIRSARSRAVTADTDLRLARYFGMSEGFFFGLQTDYDLRAKKREISTERSAIATRQAAD